MPGSTYSTNLKVELMATGENSGTWGDITNTNLGTALEQAIVGYGNPDYASDANLTISITNSNAAQAARALVLNVTSSLSLTATRELVVPTIQKQYIVQNNTTGSQSITVKTSAGTGITVPNGRKAHLYVNGTDVIQMFDFVDINGGAIDGTPIGASSASTGAFTTLNASGATTLDGNVTLGNASGDNVTVTGTITSNLLFTDNTYDIGASGATRPRNLFLAGAATIGGNLSVGGTLTLTGGVNLNGNVTVGDNSSDTLTINATITSNLLFTDNTYDIGASGATRPRNLFLAGNATVGGNQTLTGSLTVDSTTDSSSTTTGSIQTDGGLGVAKQGVFGSNLLVKTATVRANITTDTDLVTQNGLGILATSTTYGQSSQYIRFFNSAAAYAGSISQTASTAIGLYSAGDLILGASSALVATVATTSFNLFGNSQNNTWGVNYKAIDLNGSFLTANGGNTLIIGTGAYINASGNWIRTTDGYASSQYAQSVGGHIWSSAPAGTLGSAITYSYQAILNNTGYGIGASPNNRLSVYGDASTSTSFADNGVAQIVALGSSDTTKRLGLGVDTTNNRGVIQAQLYGSGTLPLAINPSGGNVLFRTTATSGAFGTITSYNNDGAYPLVLRSDTYGLRFLSASSNGFNIQAVDGTGSVSYQPMVLGAGGFLFQTGAAGGGSLTTTSVINGSGYYGINNTNPQSWVHLIANTGRQIIDTIYSGGGGGETAYGNANEINRTLVLRTSYGVNAASTSNAGNMVGIQFVGYDGSSQSQIGKSAAVFGVSEDTGGGYSRRYGLSIYTSEFDQNYRQVARFSGTGSLTLSVNIPTTTFLSYADASFTIDRYGDTAGGTGSIAFYKYGYGYQHMMRLNSSGSLCWDSYGASWGQRMQLSSSGSWSLGTTSTSYQTNIVSSTSSDYGSASFNEVLTHSRRVYKDPNTQVKIRVWVGNYCSTMLFFNYAHTNGGDYGAFIQVWLNNSYGTMFTQVVASKLTCDIGTFTTTTYSPGSGGTGYYEITMPTGNASGGFGTVTAINTVVSGSTGVYFTTA